MVTKLDDGNKGIDDIIKKILNFHRLHQWVFESRNISQFFS